MTFTHVEPDHGQLLQQISDDIASAQRVIVVTGAGISTGCGIPDFRSQDGLYSLIKGAHAKGTAVRDIAGTKGKDLFDSNLWRNQNDTETFYRFISSLRRRVAQDVKHTSMTHKLIAKLRDQRKLVRCYTQNIDGLEAREGLTMDLSQGKGTTKRLDRKNRLEPKSASTTSPGGLHDGGCEVVPLHGDLKNLRCTLCSHQTGWSARDEKFLMVGQAPPCEECETKDMIRRAVGKRGLKVGTLRPAVVLYGEQHPNADAIASITESDLKLKPDLLLVMGTSLHVHGLKNLVREFAKATHATKGGRVIFVNNTEPAVSVWGEVFDTWVQMDCDRWVQEIRRRRPQLWQAQSTITGCAAKPAAKATGLGAKRRGSGGQENSSPDHAVADVAPKASEKSKNLKRTAADAGLATPCTPSKRQPLRQLLTPPSSRRRSTVKKGNCHSRGCSFDIAGAVRSPIDKKLKQAAHSASPSSNPTHKSSRAPLAKGETPLCGAIPKKSEHAQPRSNMLVSIPPRKRPAAFTVFEDEHVKVGGDDCILETIELMPNKRARMS